jgi:hypothetical protein
MEKQIQEKPQNNAIAAASDMDAWGGGQIVTSNDIVIPKILVAQFMSAKVKDNTAKYGEFRDTLANEKFGDLDTPFEVIPFYMEKKWLEFDIVTNKSGARKREFARILPVQDNATKPGYNDDLPYVDEAAKIERDRCMDFYVLIPDQVKKGIAMPYVLSLRRTSLKAGKKLATQMFLTNARAGKVPAAVAMFVSAKSKENDDGEYAMIDVTPAREATQEEITEALRWLKLIRAGQTKVDESDLSEDMPKAKATSQVVDDERF